MIARNKQLAKIKRSASAATAPEPWGDPLGRDQWQYRTTAASAQLSGYEDPILNSTARYVTRNTTSTYMIRRPELAITENLYLESRYTPSARLSNVSRNPTIMHPIPVIHIRIPNWDRSVVERIADAPIASRNEQYNRFLT